MPDIEKEKKEKGYKEKGYKEETGFLSDKNLYLIGFMGSGKTAVARTFLREYGFGMLEMDEQIEEEQGMAISDIFRVHGEEYFRHAETDLLRRLRQKKQVVISCGGGTPMREENVALMKESGIIVWLTAKPETILQRVSRSHSRPLLEGNKNIAYITELLEKRKSKYEATADIIVSTDGKGRKRICLEILEKLREIEGET